MLLATGSWHLGPAAGRWQVGHEVGASSWHLRTESMRLMLRPVRRPCPAACNPDANIAYTSAAISSGGWRRVAHQPPVGDGMHHPHEGEGHRACVGRRDDASFLDPLRQHASCTIAVSVRVPSTRWR